LYQHLPPVHNPHHFQRFLYELTRIQPSGRFPAPEAATRYLPQPSGREMVLFFTDLYAHEDELFATLRYLNNPRNELLLFQVMGGNEAELDYAHVDEFEDLETGKRITIDIRQSKSAYRHKLQQQLRRWRKRSLDMGIDYTHFRMDEPIHLAIRQFLLRRQAMN
jgi:uncharacterized protein (DUF58 family)